MQQQILKRGLQKNHALFYIGGLKVDNKQVLTGSWCTTGIRITFVTFEARADGSVVLDVTASIEPARTNARVLAFLSLTRSVWRTVLVDHTFGTAVWRCAKHASEARADGTFAMNATL